MEAARVSNAAIDWAYAAHVTRSSDKFLLVTMANYADEDWVCFPSQTKLCGDTSLDRKTVISALRRLCEARLITDTGNRCGATKQVIVYQLTRSTHHQGDAIDPPKPPLTIPETGQLNKTINGTVKNGTVPYLPNNSPVFPLEGSRISLETVPKTGHGTSKEPPDEPPEEPFLIPPLRLDGGARRRSAKATAADPAFAAFYAAYPRKREPDDALKAWNQVLRAGATPAQIMAGLKMCGFSSDPERIKYPASWLRAGAWKTTVAQHPQIDRDPITGVELPGWNTF